MVEHREIVVKFGGTSMGDLLAAQASCEIVRSNTDRKFVVVSAPGKAKGYEKVTDLLIHLHGDTHPSKTRGEILREIESRFGELASGTNFHAGREISTLEQQLKNKESFDFIVSRGEALMAKVMSKRLGLTYVDAGTFIRFNKEGRLELPETLERAAVLKQLPGAVIPGFYGQLPDGSTKTFSRGGSDLTGSIVAAGVRARLYENWTDVTGVYMADPEVVKNPKTIPTLTQRELRELSYMGARVVHEEAVFPLYGKDIPIQVRNTWKPEETGTLIVDEAYVEEREAGTIVGIAGKKDFGYICLEKRLMNQELGFLHRATGVFFKHGVNIEHLPGGIDTVSFIVHAKDMQEKFDLLSRDLENECRPDSIRQGNGIALISVVGNAMVNTPGVLARITKALASEGINIRIVDQGSSEISIILGVQNDDYKNAVRAIYAEFVTK